MSGYAIITNFLPDVMRPLFTEERLTEEQFTQELKALVDIIPVIGQPVVARHVGQLLNCSVEPYGSWSWDVRDLADAQIYSCTWKADLNGRPRCTYHKYTPVGNRE